MTSLTSTAEPTKEIWKSFYFNRKSAWRVVNFIEKFCVHTEDSLYTKRGDRVRLEWWQKRIIMRFFGWKRHSNDARRFRTLWLEVPRKNGKTSFVAWLIAYLIFADEEMGAQIFCAAADREQADIVFGIVKQIVEANPRLKRKARIYKQSIFVPGTNSSLVVLSGRPKGKHGRNPHAICVDEVHEQADRKLIDSLRTAKIVRRQPVEIFMTTAGDDPHTICGELHDYALAVQAKPELDNTFMPVIFACDPERWKEESEWIRCNPNCGVSFDVESLRADFELAIQIPAFENTFKRLRLNIWTEQETRAIPMEKWKGCFHVRPSSLDRQPCFLGLDMSSTLDFSSGVLVFPPNSTRNYYDTLSFFWYPESNIELRKRKTKVDITPWCNKGFIRLTDGEVVDYDVVRRDINTLGRRFRILEIAVDRWNSTQLQTQLDGDGFTVVPFGQGYGSMSDPTKQFLGLILGNRLNHDNNPVLEWMARNFAIETNAAGDIKPSKKKARDKIDGMVALIMALSRALVQEHKVETSISRGLKVLRA